MSSRLVSKSVTLNDLERRNGRFCVISATSVAFSAHCVKAVEDIPKLSATAGKRLSRKRLVRKMSARESDCPGNVLYPS